MNKVIKKVLNNGLTVLVYPSSNVPKVSVQLWYNVGSKDEQSGEKGIAHLIEHMIFKGTKKLSESDINLITNKLSGYCNAFTSYDYTGYLFDFPSHHWHEALPILADCMKNCTMNEEYLNSELKAVIQELKMYKDDYTSTVVEDLISSMFPGHPYQHPIIGYKHDLWSLDRSELVNFYKKHYVPNNATLVVTGDVDPKEALELAEKSFGALEPNLDYKKQENNMVEDIGSKSVSIYRDVKQPMVMTAFKVPGAKDKKDFLIDVLCWVLATGKSSRLYKKLVQDLKLVSDVDAFSYDLFEKGLLFIEFYPHEEKNIDEIISVINQELEILAKEGPTKEEIERASNQVEMDRFSTLEDSQKQAYAIGQFYLANQDENYIFNYSDHADIENQAKEICARYLRPNLMNVGKVLAMSESDKKHWAEVQKISDEEDKRVLSRKQRTSDVEPGLLVDSIQVQKPKKFEFPKYKTFTLDNGLEVLYHHNPGLPKVDLAMELKSKYFYDPIDQPGLSNLVSHVMLEGTENYSSKQLADFIETHGMALSTTPGYISMRVLKNDLAKGVDILSEILCKATFGQDAMEDARLQIESDIKNYWDSPSQFIGQIACDNIYKDHPFCKNMLGTTDSLGSISRDQAYEFYKQNISPDGARIAIVGDLSGVDIEAVAKKAFEAWQKVDVPSIEFPQLKSPEEKLVNYHINRDQIALAFAAPSVSRKDPDYDKLLLFDQILCGGAAGSMSSKLFQLRERSGLFYTIGGSLLSRAGDQPGMAFVKTIVSMDRLEEAEKQVEAELVNSPKTISSEEFEQAKSVIKHSLVDNFKTNMKTARSFLFLRHHQLPVDFFDKRSEDIENIKVEEVQNAATKILDSSNLVKLRVGRI